MFVEDWSGSCCGWTVSASFLPCFLRKNQCTLNWAVDRAMQSNKVGIGIVCLEKSREYYNAIARETILSDIKTGMFKGDFSFFVEEESRVHTLYCTFIHSQFTYIIICVRRTSFNIICIVCWYAFDTSFFGGSVLFFPIRKYLNKPHAFTIYIVHYVGSWIKHEMRSHPICFHRSWCNNAEEEIVIHCCDSIWWDFFPWTSIVKLNACTICCIFSFLQLTASSFRCFVLQ